MFNWILIVKVLSDFSIIIALTSYLFPLLITKNLAYVAYVSIICIYTYYFLFKNLNKVDYYSFIEEFKRGVGYIGAIFAISVFSNKLIFFEKVTTVYLIIYLVSSIILLMSLRYMEYNKDDKRINLTNFKYYALVILLSFSLCINFVRNFLVYTLYQFYNFIINIFISLLSWILFAIGRVLQCFIEFFNRQLSNMNQPQVSVQPQHSPFENMENINRIDIVGFFKNNILVNLFMQIIIIVVIIIVIIWILRRRNNFSQVKEEYTQSKEFMTVSKESNMFKGLNNIFKSKTSIEYIRYYYLKYLRMCITKNIDIKDSDTSLDVYNKSKNHYNIDVINSLREIYIKVRYNNLSPSNKEKKKYLNIYKKL
jgi:hypothetical protein